MLKVLSQARDVGGPVAPPMLPLEVRGLCFASRGKALVDHLDAQITGLGISMVMGPNGAGKSLFLRLIHGLLPPSAGEIRWGGAPLSPAIARRQALVFQKPVLLRRSVAANLDFALNLRKANDPARREDLLAAVGLVALARQPARLLSGGEQQRLALARALATEPDVLLLDEPTANLDPASTALIERLVLSAVDQGCKVIFVTHDQGQARRLADDVVFIHQGRVTAHQPAATFFATPSCQAAHRYLAGELVY